MARYSAEHQTAFSEADVTAGRESLRQMVALTGQFGVPVVLASGEVMIGLDPAEFERLLAG